MRKDMPVAKLGQVSDSGTPLFVQVRDQLRAAILSGQFKAGERLPSEAAMIDRFGVSRITVRQALAELQSVGLVATVSGKGSYVTMPEETSVHNSFVGVLETMRKRGYRVRAEMLWHREMPASAEVARALQIPPRSPIGAVRVLRFRDDVPFVVGTTFIEVDSARRLAEQNLAEIDVATAMERNLGMRIGETQVQVNALPAEAAVARQLQCPAGAPILRIRVLSFDYDRQPKSLSLTDCRGDMMDYRVTLRRGGDMGT